MKYYLFIECLGLEYLKKDDPNNIWGGLVLYRDNGTKLEEAQLSISLWDAVLIAKGNKRKANYLLKSIDSLEWKKSIFDNLSDICSVVIEVMTELEPSHIEDYLN